MTALHRVHRPHARPRRTKQRKPVLAITKKKRGESVFFVTLKKNWIGSTRYSDCCCFAANKNPSTSGRRSGSPRVLTRRPRTPTRPRRMVGITATAINKNTYDPHPVVTLDYGSIGTGLFRSSFFIFTESDFYCEYHLLRLLSVHWTTIARYRGFQGFVSLRTGVEQPRCLVLSGEI